MAWMLTASSGPRRPLWAPGRRPERGKHCDNASRFRSARVRPSREAGASRPQARSELDQGDSDEWPSGLSSEARTTAGRPAPPPASPLTAARRRLAIAARITPLLATPRSTRAIREARPLLADREEVVPVYGV